MYWSKYWSFELAPLAISGRRDIPVVPGNAAGSFMLTEWLVRCAVSMAAENRFMVNKALNLGKFLLE
jgi:hypothetical protein